MKLKPYQPVVAAILNQARPSTILDAPSGSGWLRTLLDFDTALDGIDLFEQAPTGYRNFCNADLDLGLPDDFGTYEAIVCCEGIEHLGSPDFFFKSVRRHLGPGGRLIVTTPNTWYPESRLQFFLRGFFPSFPSLVGKIKRGSHMHIMPWSFPQLYLYLRLNGFDNITLHDIDEPKPKRFYERIFGVLPTLYCRNRQRKAGSTEEQIFWQQAGSRQSIFGRRLVVSAVAPA